MACWTFSRVSPFAAVLEDLIVTALHPDRNGVDPRLDNLFKRVRVNHICAHEDLVFQALVVVSALDDPSRDQLDPLERVAACAVSDLIGPGIRIVVNG
jgi:hypothetical protein